MKKITNKELFKKLEARPFNCPFCGSDNFDLFSSDNMENGSAETYCCLVCGETWLEEIEYMLVKAKRLTAKEAVHNKMRGRL